MDRCLCDDQDASVSEYFIGMAGPEDLVAVARLIERKPKLSAADMTERQQATWGRMMATDDLRVYLAWHDNDAVGTSALLVMPHITYSCHPTAFIEAMHVRDEHRRRGVGRMMVERSLNDARTAGCRKVQLLACRLYLSYGIHNADSVRHQARTRTLVLAGVAACRDHGHAPLSLCVRGRRQCVGSGSRSWSAPRRRPCRPIIQDGRARARNPSGNGVASVCQ